MNPERHFPFGRIDNAHLQSRLLLQHHNTNVFHLFFPLSETLSPLDPLSQPLLYKWIRIGRISSFGDPYSPLVVRLQIILPKIFWLNFSHESFSTKWSQTSAKSIFTQAMAENFILRTKSEFNFYPNIWETKIVTKSIAYLLYGTFASLPSLRSNIAAWPNGMSLRFAWLRHLEQ